MEGIVCDTPLQSGTEAINETYDLRSIHPPGNEITWCLVEIPMRCIEEIESMENAQALASVIGRYRLLSRNR